MESIGSSFFLMLLAAGILVLLRRKKIPGLVLIGLALCFLFIAPAGSKREFQKSVYGEYRFGDTVLFINKDGTYEMQVEHRPVCAGSVAFFFIDHYYVLFQGNRDLERRSDGSFGYQGIDSIAYVKIR